MIFGRLKLDDAEGALIAHSLMVGKRRLKKGHVLTAADISELRQSGADNVLAARLEDGDIDEDTAARAIAERLVGPNTSLVEPFTGRCNIFADMDGVARFDVATIDAVNQIDEGITVATVHRDSMVAGRQMLATVKIIPFAVTEDTLQAVLNCLSYCRIEVARFSGQDVSAICTRLPGTKPSLIDKSFETLAARLAGRGSTLRGQSVVEHHERDLATELERLSAAGSGPVIIFPASAITDRRDVVPAAITAAGGEVIHYGMPVDPGNLLLVGRIGDTPIIGAPGCARSPKDNGFDIVLNWLLSDIEVTSESVKGLGVGGLLKDIGARGHPRDGAAPDKSDPAMPRIAAVVLAAGQSRRMGAENKLTLQIDGKPMLRHTLEQVTASQVTETVVVTGHQAADVTALLAEMSVSVAHNPDYAAGLSTSLATGLGALPDDCDGALVCLGDMPAIRADHLNRLIAAFNPVEGRAICVPVHDGKRGNPVIFDRRFFAEMRDVAGDTGARHLIGEYGEMVVEVPFDDDAVLSDIDTKDALKSYLAGEKE